MFWAMGAQSAPSSIKVTAWQGHWRGCLERKVFSDSQRPQGHCSSSAASASGFGAPLVSVCRAPRRHSPGQLPAQELSPGGCSFLQLLRLQRNIGRWHHRDLGLIPPAGPEGRSHLCRSRAETRTQDAQALSSALSLHFCQCCQLSATDEDICRPCCLGPYALSRCH